MKKVMFICHGNICRSTMAEMMFKHMVKDSKEEWIIDSSGTSTEEIGNDIHPKTKQILTQYGIPFTKRRAKQITKEEFDSFDYLICMDRKNMHNCISMFNDSPKIKRILDYCSLNRDVKDPWYTDNYQETYDDLILGLEAFLIKEDNR